MSKIFQIWFSYLFPSRLLAGLAVVYKVVATIAAFAGFSGGAILAFFSGHIWLAFIIVIVLTAWFSLTAGMALVTARGPSVEVLE